MCRRFIRPPFQNVTRSSFVILLSAQQSTMEGELEVKLVQVAVTRTYVVADKKVALLNTNIPTNTKRHKQKGFVKAMYAERARTHAHTASALASHLCLIRRQ